MSGRRSTLVVSTAAKAFLAAGLFSLLACPVAYADGDDSSPSVDTDFMSHTDNFGLFTDTAAADPGDSEYVANVIQGPLMNGSPLFTDVLTSGADPSDSLGFGTTGIGMAGDTVNTLIVPSLDIDSTITLPFTDPLAEIWTALVPFGF